MQFFGKQGKFANWTVWAYSKTKIQNFSGWLGMVVMLMSVYKTFWEVKNPFLTGFRGFFALDSQNLPGLLYSACGDLIFWSTNHHQWRTHDRNYWEGLSLISPIRRACNNNHALSGEIERLWQRTCRLCLTTVKGGWSDLGDILK